MNSSPVQNHALTPDPHRLDPLEKLALAVLALGLAAFVTGLFYVNEQTPGGARFLWLCGAWGAVVGGGMLYGIRKYAKQLPGVRNHGVTSESLTARGAVGWLLAILFTAFYICLYWYPSLLEGWIRLHDPLAQALQGKPADQWFVYGTFYTAAVAVMGAKALAKHRHSRYQIVRISCIIFVQSIFAWILPALLAKLSQPEAALTYFWPLEYDKLMPDNVHELLSWRTHFATFCVFWFVAGTFVLAPVLTYFFGKRWYCSWVCGCGGLANTAGDQWRQLSDKSLRAWRLERWTVHSVLLVIVLLTGFVWLAPRLPEAFQASIDGARKWYGFLIGLVFSGVIGVGLYPLLGTRVWCRFGCPMAAYLGLLQKYFSRFRITANGSQCISCGNCSTYCEMGIDVKWYAQRSQNIVRASCVGCGLCAEVCPRGVLNLENGPTAGRVPDAFSLAGPLKARPPRA